MHLPLIYQAFDIVVNELDRVFDRDDMVLAAQVNVIDHRAQRRRFAGTGRACNDDKTLRKITQIQYRLGKSELVRGRHLHWNDAENAAHSLTIHKNVATKAGQAFDL